MSFQNGDLSRKSECLICVYHKKQITDNDKITFPHDISNCFDICQSHKSFPIVIPLRLLLNQLQKLTLSCGKLKILYGLNVLPFKLKIRRCHAHTDGIEVNHNYCNIDIKTELLFNIISIHIFISA